MLEELQEEVLMGEELVGLAPTRAVIFRQQPEPGLGAFQIPENVGMLQREEFRIAAGKWPTRSS
jgi:hypothetical protein